MCVCVYVTSILYFLSFLSLLYPQSRELRIRILEQGKETIYYIVRKSTVDFYERKKGG